MTSYSFDRGYKTYYNEEKKEWLYCDDDTSAKVERQCKNCGHMPLETGEDWCLGNIPNVKNACCGHGVIEGYFQLEDGRIFREELPSPRGFCSKVEYEKNENSHTIWIRQYKYGELKSQVSIKGQNDNFDENLEAMEKICNLIDSLEENLHSLNQIKAVLRKDLTKEYEAIEQLLEKKNVEKE